MSQYLTSSKFRRGGFGLRYGRSVLGDASSGWSVKAYTVGGKTVWGSYQSPATNNAIIEMQNALNKMGVACNTDGLVGAQMVAAMKELERRAQFVKNDVVGGETVGRLLSAAKPASGWTAQGIAQGGAAIRVVLITLAAQSWFVKSMKNLGAGKAPTTPTTAPPKAPGGGGSTIVVAPPADQAPPPDAGGGAGLEVGLARLSSTQKMGLGAMALLAGVMLAKKGRMFR